MIVGVPVVERCDADVVEAKTESYPLRSSADLFTTVVAGRGDPG
jgi:hypothetical protein